MVKVNSKIVRIDNEVIRVSSINRVSKESHLYNSNLGQFKLIIDGTIYSMNSLKELNETFDLIVKEMER